MANSKISKADKQWLKLAKAEIPNVHFHNNEETTIAFRDNPNCNTVEFALSVASPDEVKFRRKVGEYYAMDRMICGNTVKMKRKDFREMMYSCYDYFW